MINKNKVSKDIYEPFINFRKNIKNLENEYKLSNIPEFQTSLKQIIYINQEIEMTLSEKRIENFELSIMRVGIEFICKKFNWKVNEIVEEISKFLNENISTSLTWNKYFMDERTKKGVDWLKKEWWNGKSNVIKHLNEPHHASEDLFKPIDPKGHKFETFVNIFDIYKNLVKLYIHYHNYERGIKDLSNKLLKYDKKNEFGSNDALNLDLKSFTSTYDFLLDWNNCNKYNDSEIFVPFYQRKFIWKKENIALLFKNIIELKDNESHFIGNIYLYIGVGHYNKNIAELLDGQQRIISIELFLNTIYLNIKNLSNILNKNEPNERENIIDTSSIDYKKMNKEVSKLISNELDGIDDEISNYISDFNTFKARKGITIINSNKEIDLLKNNLKKLLKSDSFSIVDNEIDKCIDKYTFTLSSSPENTEKENKSEIKLKNEIKLFYLKNLEKKIMYNLNFFVNLFIGNFDKDNDGIPEIFVNLNTTGMKLSISEVCFAQIFSKIQTNIKEQKNRHSDLENHLHKFFVKYKRTIDKDNFIKLLIYSATKKKWILGSGENNIFKIFKNEFLNDFELIFSNDTKDKHISDFDKEIKKIFYRTDDPFINYSNLYIFMFLKYEEDYKCLKYDFWKNINNIRESNEKVFSHKICKEILYIIISRYFFHEKYDFKKNELQTETFFNQIEVLSENLKNIIETKNTIYTHPLSRLKTSLIYSERLSSYNPPYNKENELNDEKLKAKHIYKEMKEIIIKIFEKDINIIE